VPELATFLGSVATSNPLAIVLGPAIYFMTKQLLSIMNNAYPGYIDKVTEDIENMDEEDVEAKIEHIANKLENMDTSDTGGSATQIDETEILRRYLIVHMLLALIISIIMVSQLFLSISKREKVERLADKYLAALPLLITAPPPAIPLILGLAVIFLMIKLLNRVELGKNWEGMSLKEKKNIAFLSIAFIAGIVMEWLIETGTNIYQLRDKGKIELFTEIAKFTIIGQFISTIMDTFVEMVDKATQCKAADQAPRKPWTTPDNIAFNAVADAFASMKTLFIVNAAIAFALETIELLIDISSNDSTENYIPENYETAEIGVTLVSSLLAIIDTASKTDKDYMEDMKKIAKETLEGIKRKNWESDFWDLYDVVRDSVVKDTKKLILIRLLSEATIFFLTIQESGVLRPLTEAAQGILNNLQVNIDENTANIGSKIIELVAAMIALAVDKMEDDAISLGDIFSALYIGIAIKQLALITLNI